MRSITRLFGAVGTLADSILTLATLVDAASGRLRQQLGLDGETAPATLAHTGDVLDNETAGNTGVGKSKRSRAGG